MKKYILLLIVAVSLIAVAVQLSRPNNTVNNNIGVDPTMNTQTIVYYFHADIDCLSCVDIKSYTQEALDPAKVTWQPVNIDTPGNEHYIQDYKLTSTSVILALFHKGKLVKYKLLPDVWTLVKDKPTFIEYIRSEIKNIGV